MSESSLLAASNQLADAVASISPSVVQVQGRRRPASGVVFAPDAILTTARALGRENGARVRTPDGRTLDTELAGWDPATHVAVLRAADLAAPPAELADAPARVGHLALAVARSWSNAVTASAGIVATIGGPLATGRGYAIDQIIRTTAPMHDGFSGGAFVDASGRVVGLTTAVAIRGLGVVIPSAIAWRAAREVLEGGHAKRGYLGIAGQAVTLSDTQREIAGVSHALLIAGVTSGSPADAAGLLVGDLMLALGDQAIDAPERLLGALSGDSIGATQAVRILRGDGLRDLQVQIGARPSVS